MANFNTHDFKGNASNHNIAKQINVQNSENTSPSTRKTTTNPMIWFLERLYDNNNYNESSIFIITHQIILTRYPSFAPLFLTKLSDNIHFDNNIKSIYKSQIYLFIHSKLIALSNLLSLIDEIEELVKTSNIPPTTSGLELYARIRNWWNEKMVMELGYNQSTKWVVKNGEDNDWFFWAAVLTPNGYIWTPGYVEMIFHSSCYVQIVGGVLGGCDYIMMEYMDLCAFGLEYNFYQRSSQVAQKEGVAVEHINAICDILEALEMHDGDATDRFFGLVSKKRVDKIIGNKRKREEGEEEEYERNICPSAKRAKLDDVTSSIDNINNINTIDSLILNDELNTFDKNNNTNSNESTNESTNETLSINCNVSDTSNTTDNKNKGNINNITNDSNENRLIKSNVNNNDTNADNDEKEVINILGELGEQYYGVFKKNGYGKIIFLKLMEYNDLLLMNIPIGHVRYLWGRIEGLKKRV